MDLPDEYRLRMRNCVGTIIDVYGAIGRTHENEALLSEFQDLEEAINGLDMDLVSEVDILMIEQATNTILVELKHLLDTVKSGLVYANKLN